MSRNDELFARAQRSIPAGVNSPVRAFRSVGGAPFFVKAARGADIPRQRGVIVDDEQRTAAIAHTGEHGCLLAPEPG